MSYLNVQDRFQIQMRSMEEFIEKEKLDHLDGWLRTKRSVLANSNKKQSKMSKPFTLLHLARLEETRPQKKELPTSSSRPRTSLVFSLYLSLEFNFLSNRYFYF